jgi:1-acyl-sn-glycerol-3-phosphate acyltransferase
MSFPRIGAALPRRDTPFTTGLAQATLRAAGWGIEGNFPDVPKLVVVVAPHTSNWDFIVGVAAIFALHLRVRFLAKHTLFRFPFNLLMRPLGGIPVDRSRSHGVVAQVIEDFQRYDKLALAITPEGTRKRGARWKEGFYHIALGAKVPVSPVTFDYRARRIFIGPALNPSGDAQAEIEALKAFCDGDQHAAELRAKLRIPPG